MKKALLLLLSVGAISAVQAQKFNLKANASKLQNNNFYHGSSQKPAGTCDTANLAESANWSPVYYSAQDANGNFVGYVFGPSDYPDIGGSRLTINESANYFDVSSTSSNYITGAAVFFAVAKTNVSADLSKNLIFKVYEDNGGLPGNLLGSASLTLASVKDDVDNGFATNVVFDAPIALPSSKKFYFSVDHTAFKYRVVGTQDEIAITSNLDGESASEAFQYYKYFGSNSWIDVPSLWGLNAALFIFPYLAEDQSGCTLPITFRNFNGNIKNNQAVLNWITLAEINNKGFYIERSIDGKNFSSIGFVNGNGAGTTTQQKSYTYTDTKLADLKAATVYYRLKQVDMDGKTAYSGVLQLKTGDIVNWNVYPNPVTSNSWVQFNTNTTANVNVKVVASDGRIVMNIDKGILQAGTYTIPLNMSQASKGIYFVKLTVGDKTYTQTVTK